MRVILLCLFLGSCSLMHDIGTWRPNAGPAVLAGISGASYGVHETVVHHPWRIPKSWDQQWWDSRLSWPKKGNTFLGKTIGSFGTDAKHTFGPIHRWTLYGAGAWSGLGMKASAEQYGSVFGKKRPAIHYVLDIGLNFVAFSVGFHATYSLAFNH